MRPVHVPAVPQPRRRAVAEIDAHIARAEVTCARYLQDLEAFPGSRRTRVLLRQAEARRVPPRAAAPEWTSLTIQPPSGVAAVHAKDVAGQWGGTRQAASTSISRGAGVLPSGSSIWGQTRQPDRMIACADIGRSAW